MARGKRNTRGERSFVATSAAVGFLLSAARGSFAPRAVLVAPRLCGLICVPSEDQAFPYGDSMYVRIPDRPWEALRYRLLGAIAQHGDGENNGVGLLELFAHFWRSIGESWPLNVFHTVTVSEMVDCPPGRFVLRVAAAASRTWGLGQSVEVPFVDEVSAAITEILLDGKWLQASYCSGWPVFGVLSMLVEHLQGACSREGAGCGGTARGAVARSFDAPVEGPFSMLIDPFILGLVDSKKDAVGGNGGVMEAVEVDDRVPLPFASVNFSQGVVDVIPSRWQVIVEAAGFGFSVEGNIAFMTGRRGALRVRGIPASGFATIAFWAGHSLGVGKICVLSFPGDETAVGPLEFVLLLNPDGHASVVCRAGGDRRVGDVIVDAVARGWNQHAFVFANATVRWFVNGRLACEVVWSRENLSSQSVLLGNFPNILNSDGDSVAIAGIEFFDGDLDSSQLDVMRDLGSRRTVIAFQSSIQSCIWHGSSRHLATASAWTSLRTCLVASTIVLDAMHDIQGRMLFGRGRCPQGTVGAWLDQQRPASVYPLCVRTEMNNVDDQVKLKGSWGECTKLWTVLQRVNAKKGCTILDVGANIGICTLMLLKLGFNVVAFEPNTRNFELLVASLRLNGFRPVQLRQLHGGLAGTSLIGAVTTFNFALGERQSMGITTERVGNAGDTKVFAQGLSPDCDNKTVFCQQSLVRIERLDDVFGEYDWNRMHGICMVKIDTQGYELRVLEGARGLMRKGLFGLIFFEWRPEDAIAKGEEPEKPLRILLTWGFTLLCPLHWFKFDPLESAWFRFNEDHIPVILTQKGNILAMRNPSSSF
eukprot:TRINITY_DN29353_c0_g1_i1.p1 TRINITY_DN29353_c0_g1~~TRINITY_DN29353_c0_g1_i1.p1  ORF type:complete len:818 (-),score=110.26 TRINITY_DN29353_c0_g1_i1:59-2512(-)